MSIFQIPTYQCNWPIKMGQKKYSLKLVVPYRLHNSFSLSWSSTDSCEPKPSWPTMSSWAVKFITFVWIIFVHPLYTCQEVVPICQCGTFSSLSSPKSIQILLAVPALSHICSLRKKKKMIMWSKPNKILVIQLNKIGLKVP